MYILKRQVYYFEGLKKRIMIRKLFYFQYRQTTSGHKLIAMQQSSFFFVFVQLLSIGLFFSACSLKYPKNITQRSDMEYHKIQEKLATGWNTWDTRSVLSHVLLPEGLSIKLILKNDVTGKYLKKALVEQGDYQLSLIAHSYDGSYTELNLNWGEIKIKVQSATTNGGVDQVILVTPLEGGAPGTGKLIIDPEILWGRAGLISTKYGSRNVGKDTIYAYFPNNRVEIYYHGTPATDTYFSENQFTGILSLSSPSAISTGKNRPLAEVQQIILRAKSKLQESNEVFGGLKDIYDVVQTVLSWNVIYDPSNRRVISPVSREWSSNSRGGYVLFCWDNLFAAYMFSAGSKELAYANLIETIKIVDKVGFVPNNNGGNDISRDRSQPPIGSLMTEAVYKKFKEKWLIEELFDRLLKWNRWWQTARDRDGYLCWGSDPYQGMNQSIYSDSGITRAKWESGLDNSPMYDSIPYNPQTHMMDLADVGLMSLYIADCDALANLASEIGRTNERRELLQRAEKYRNKLNSLWDEKAGIYLNKNLKTGKLSHRISPTNFYPLLAKAPSQQQAERMMQEHFFNPNEFWGDYIMPSIARNDPAFGDNNYWRGRIWAPMNFLVYLGMLNYDLPKARNSLVEKSNELLMKSWLSNRYVFENYNAVTGQGDDVQNSDHFYHWGGLLGFMKLIEKKQVSAP